MIRPRSCRGRPTGRLLAVLATVALGAALLPSDASASLVVTSGSTAGGESVSAKATLTFGAGTITITLENLIVDQKDAGQSVTGFSFTMGSILNTGATETSSSGRERTINGSTKTYTDGITRETGWGFDKLSTNGLGLNWFDRDKNIAGHNAQSTLIGQPGAGNKYNNANSSITNSAHTPELAGPLTFVLHVSGVTAATDGSGFSNFLFKFSTTAGVTAGGSGAVVTTFSAAPEPSTMLSALAGLGPMGLIFLSRHRRRSQAVSA